METRTTHAYDAPPVDADMHARIRYVTQRRDAAVKIGDDATARRLDAGILRALLARDDMADAA